MDTWLPIQILVNARLAALGISKAELARRCGCRNVDKGIRRINAICEGSIEHPRAREIASLLTKALEVDPTIFAEALLKSRMIVELDQSRREAEQENAWRDAFVPHGYLLTERNIPEQITFCGMAGGSERFLRVAFDLRRAPLTLAVQARMAAKRVRYAGFYGPIVGFVVNYSPDRAVQFDLDGKPEESLPMAYRPRQIRILMAGRQ
jgi:transcriptional regulator with XRE-family HTH domain